MLLLLPPAARAQLTGIQFLTTTSNNQITITGFTASGTGPLLIPSVLNGLPVVAVGSYSFEYATNLTGVTISSGITSIAESAFYGDTGLTSVVMPDSVTEIGAFAFQGCTNLAQVSLGTGVTAIDAYAFNGCRALSSISLPCGLTTVGNSAFVGTSLSTVTIPASVTSIGFDGLAFTGSAFFLGNAPADLEQGALPGLVYYTAGATGFTTPTWVYNTTFAFGHYQYSTATTAVITDPSLFTTTTANGQVTITGYTGPVGAVVIPPVINGLSVATIGSSAFLNQTGLTSVVIPGSVTAIQANAFEGCTGLTNFLIPGTVTTVGVSAFQGCSGLTSLLIDNGVATIGDDAFANCPNLTTLTIPASVTSFGTYSVANMAGLTSVNVSPQNAVYSSVGGVLFNANGTTLLSYPQALPSGTYTIPAGVTTIGVAAFMHCANLSGVVIPNSVTSLSDAAFLGCRSLARVTVGNGVTSLGQEAFSDCPFASIALPNSLISIGSGAFDSCQQLASISIPNSVTTIGDNAFYNCDKLTNVTFGNGVTRLGSTLFENCPNVARAIFLGNAPTMSPGALSVPNGFFTIEYLDTATGFATPDWRPDSFDLYYHVYPIGTFNEWSTCHQVTAAGTATPQNDAIPNLLKYVFDIDPSAPMSATDRAALPIVGTYASTSPAAQYLTLTYRKNPLATGVTVQVQTSTDLATWSTPSNLMVVPMGTDPATGDPMMQAQVPISSTTQFVRLNASQP